MKRQQIAINTRHWIPGKMEGIGRFVMNISRILCCEHPETDFHFIFDRKIDFASQLPANVFVHQLFPPARHLYIYPFWYNIAIPLLLRKINADIFLSLDNFNSTRLKCKSITCIHDINFEHYPNDLPLQLSRYYRKNTPKFIAAATKVVTVSEFSADDIAKTYNVPHEKIDVVYNGLGNHFYNSKTVDIVKTRCEISGGKPYFIAIGSINPRKNIARLIDAYNIFRESTNFDFPLVITGKNLWRNYNLDKDVSTSKFAKDIIFTGYLDDDGLQKTLSAALSLVFVSYFEGFGVPLIEAFYSGVPVIAANASAMPEICQDAALFVDPFDVADISRKMGMLASDESLRIQLVEKGKQRVVDFSWEKSAAKMWNIIQDVIFH